MKRRRKREKDLKPYQGIDRSKWTLQDFILEGTGITWEVQETETAETGNQFIAVDAHNHFMIWYLELREFLSKTEYIDKKHPGYLKLARLLEAGRVPRIKGGIDYGDPRSIKSQNLLKNIREELKDTLKILREVELIATTHKRSDFDADSPRRKPGRPFSKKEASAKILVTDKALICGNTKVPLERGQRQIYLTLEEQARIYRGKRLAEKGESVNRNILQQRGGYRDEPSFRSALNKLRSKLNAHTLPVKILNPTTNHYLLEIKYDSNI